MANIAVRKENETKPALVPSDWRLEPFRMMRDFMDWDPFREMMPYVRPLPAEFAPDFEVKETKDGYVFKADVPGVKEKDLEVTLTGNRLTITGRREAEKQEQADTYYTYERTYGAFTRAFTLPEGIEPGTLAADLRDGVLTIGMKKLPEVQPKKIDIKTPIKTS
jgi:HSP20 family protein